MSSAAVCILTFLFQTLNVNDNPQPCSNNDPNKSILDLTIDNPHAIPDAAFGQSMVVLDFDGDGHNDLAVGAPGYKRRERGRVYVIFGPRVWTNAANALWFEAPMSFVGDRFGNELAAMDVDGDGADELFVGCPYASVVTSTATYPDAGHVYAYTYQAGSESLLLDLVSSSPYLSQGAHFGQRMVVGDFLPNPGKEIAISAPDAVVPGASGSFAAGAVHVFSDLLNPTVGEVALPNPQATHNGSQFGTSVIHGDWNGDGLDDLVIGAIYNNAQHMGTTYLAAGQAYVYTHPASPSTFDVLDNPDPTSDYVFTSVPPQNPPPCFLQRFGQVVASADIDGDGFAEVAVGSSRKDFPNPCSENDTCDVGLGFLFSGGSGAPTTSTTFVHHPRPRNCDIMTYRINFIDLIGDDSPDFVVGCLANESAGGACGSPPSTPYNKKSILIWDGDSLASPTIPAGPPDVIYYRPDGSGSHFCRAILGGDLDNGIGRPELILGDDKYSGQSGRVIIAFWQNAF